MSSAGDNARSDRIGLLLLLLTLALLGLELLAIRSSLAFLF